MILPILITILGGIFRFTNLNWDAGLRLHPDEALIINGAHAVRFFSHLFPGFFDYNGFSVYLVRATALAISWFTNNPYWSQNVIGMTMVGRFLSALLATLSIPLVYLLGKSLWNKTVGVLAAFFLACTPLAIQLAHFYTTESILVFFFAPSRIMCCFV